MALANRQSRCGKKRRQANGTAAPVAALDGMSAEEASVTAFLRIHASKRSSS
jgi:hypothetical protein